MPRIRDRKKDPSRLQWAMTKGSLPDHRIVKEEDAGVRGLEPIV